MLPSQSSFNRMRVFMKDKPHRWGTKLFMLCCQPPPTVLGEYRVFLRVHHFLAPVFCYRGLYRTKTYCTCIIFEVYCGKQEQPNGGSLTDYNSGPATVIRNLREVFGRTGPGTGAMRLIVTDRFYTSVP
ncbi:hypothetical protein PHMEG_00019921 [Phytophthora megakarya]|uniref:PiggyBac transposable element-derived protein domain-containing protein n=1 Tax=Phytophthora megakarya TaxID=4795 RepID=A0A225VQ53_9STRA|nr:hypothetical protein PHMEG_00019921 [Phytophthora megakarya]